MAAREVPPHRSLLVRLLATSMLIAVCAIAATAWLTVQITTHAVTREQSRALSADTDVYDALIDYSATHHNWAGARATVRRLAFLTGRRIVLTTMDREAIVDSADGPPLRDAVPTATVDPLYLDAALARGSAGRIDPRAVGPYRLTEGERRTLHKLAEDQVSCARQLDVPTEIVETPSGRPNVRLVSTETDRDAGYYLNCDTNTLQRPVRTERAPLAELTALVKECQDPELGAANISPTFSVRYDRPPADNATMTSARQCVEDSRRTQLKPYVAPPALLFIVGPATTSAPTVDLSQSNTLRVVGVTGIVLAVALAATIIVGVRLVRPLRVLTDAVRQPVESQRQVPVTTHDEIGYLAMAFNDLAERRLALEEQRKAMVNDIAHELRTPLTNIRTWLEAARDGVTDVDPELLDLLVEESMLLHLVVDDLRDLASADAGNLRLHPEPTFVNEVVTQVIDAHRGAADAAGVALTLRPEADPEVRVDPVRLRQMIGNLVSNAIRHTPRGGAVTLRVALDGRRLLIEVTDTGTGISPEDLPRVFDRFWRADGSRSRSTGGSGLGLAIARQLARAHGGDITVTSRPGRGSTFGIALPTDRP